MMLFIEIWSGGHGDFLAGGTIQAAALGATQGYALAGVLVLISVVMFAFARRLSRGNSKTGPAMPEARASEAQVAPSARSDAPPREPNAPSVHTWAPKTGAFGTNTGG